jgi:hypothetical protein
MHENERFRQEIYALDGEETIVIQNGPEPGCRDVVYPITHDPSR